MKGFSILILLALLLLSDYAFAQVCPCDTLETPDGTTGNDIIEQLCPGGELGEGTLFELNQFVVAIGTESEFYQVLNISDLGTGCAIFAGGDGNGTETTFQDYVVCRELLIQRCNLQRISPIPTLSEWGLIAMAGVLGVFGLYAAMRRRKAAV